MIFKVPIMAYVIKMKMERLFIRRKTLKGLIKEAQQDYFGTGSLSEGSYNIKVKKYAEMVRDIDRQIPLLKEQLARLRKEKKHASIIEERKRKKK